MTVNSELTEAGEPTVVLEAVMSGVTDGFELERSDDGELEMDDWQPASTSTLRRIPKIK
jgi:hypothetical protein